MSGKMRTRLTLQQKSGAPDGGGGLIVTWEDVAANPVVYAEMTPLSAGERKVAGQDEHATAFRFRIRHRQDITADMRLIDTARIYNILSIQDPEGRGRYLDIIAAARNTESID